jgi:ammonia channel protein AmtB
MHNVPFVMIGASLLWFGWFGFNAGSAVAANGLGYQRLCCDQYGNSRGSYQLGCL